METGILLTAPGGAKFWHPCKDAAAGLKDMARQQADARLFGDAWEHADSTVEFGTFQGDTFTARVRLWPKA